jgi:hypothetical protein
MTVLLCAGCAAKIGVASRDGGFDLSHDGAAPQDGSISDGAQA